VGLKHQGSDLNTYVSKPNLNKIFDYKQHISTSLHVIKSGENAGRIHIHGYNSYAVKFDCLTVPNYIISTSYLRLQSHQIRNIKLVLNLISSESGRFYSSTAYIGQDMYTHTHTHTFILTVAETQLLSLSHCYSRTLSYTAYSRSVILEFFNTRLIQNPHTSA
jgi:hypothetical protein